LTIELENGEKSCWLKSTGNLRKSLNMSHLQPKVLWGTIFSQKPSVEPSARDSASHMINTMPRIQDYNDTKGIA